MKIKATITGPKVQGVGYRVFLMHEAILEGIDRFAAMNVSDDTVIVLVEADEATISSFKEFLSSYRPEHAQVSAVKIDDFNGRVMTLMESTMLNTVEQMDKAIPILISMNEKMHRIGENTSLIPKIADNTSLIPKIADNTSLIPKIAENTNLIPEIADNARSIPKILEEVQGMRQEVQPGFSVQFRQAQEDIRAIKERLGMP